jgi:hypothetical protein
MSITFTRFDRTSSMDGPSVEQQFFSQRCLTGIRVRNNGKCTTSVNRIGKLGHNLSLPSFSRGPKKNRVILRESIFYVNQKGTKKAEARCASAASEKSSLTGFSGHPFAVTFFPVTIGILFRRHPLTVDRALSLFRGTGSPGFATHTSESRAHEDEHSDKRFFHVKPPKAEIIRLKSNEIRLNNA